MRHYATFKDYLGDPTGSYTVGSSLSTNRVRARIEILKGHMPAVLTSEGFAGIASASLCKVNQFLCPVEVFTDPRRAQACSGAADESPSISEVDHPLGEVVGADSILTALRTYLSQNPGRADLKLASTALGMSGRALQRKLKKAHTSFRAEQNAAQIRVAKCLLRDTNHEIKRVAFEVGCSSLAAFSALFHRIEGQTPSSWRNQVETIR